MSNITILGSGRVGSNLATHLAQAGHHITVGARQPADPRPAWATPDMTIADHPVAVRASRIIINATPGETSLERLTALRAELDDRILIDVANAVTRDPAGDVTLVYPNSSLAEHLQLALPGTRVVKTLNTMLFSVMTDPHATKIAPVAFLSGNDDHAKAVTAALLGDLGWPTEWIEDLGGVTSARGLEAFMLLVPSIARNRGMVPFAMALAI